MLISELQAEIIMAASKANIFTLNLINMALKLKHNLEF